MKKEQKYICVNEFGQITEMTEVAVLTFFSNSKWDFVDAVTLLNQGKRVYLNEHEVYIQKVI